jgi:hypothetical protein
VATAEEAASICNKKKKKHSSVFRFCAPLWFWSFAVSRPARHRRRGSSRAALGGSLDFQRTPGSGSGSSNTAQSKNRRLKCNVALATILFLFFILKNSLK